MTKNSHLIRGDADIENCIVLLFKLFDVVRAPPRLQSPPVPYHPS